MCEGRVPLLVLPGDGQHARGRVNGGHGDGGWQAGGGFGEDAATAANVEITELVEVGAA